MSMTIKLDAAAVRELFPEGSEARVEVIKAVAIDFVRRCATKEFTGPIFSQLRQVAVNEAYSAVTSQSDDIGFKLVGAGFNQKGVVYITDSMKERIAGEVKERLSAEIKSAITEQVESIKDQVMEKVQRELDAIPDATVKAAKAVIVEKLNAALRA